MEIGQLEAFLGVVREGSFTRAAERLSLTQPSLSARIHQLEQSLGSELFTRDKRPVQLTVMGEIFFDYAERAIGILDAGCEAVRSARLGVTGRVTVACPFSLATYLMPAVVDRFRKSFPQAELHLETGHSDFTIKQLLDGLVNISLAAAFPRFLSQTQTILRLHDEMSVVVAPGHPLVDSENIPVDAIWAYQGLIIHWGREFDGYIESLRQISGSSTPTIRIPLAVALPMVRQENTITFMPRRLAIASGLVELDVPEFQFDWGGILVTRQGRVLTAVEQAFVDIVSAAWEETVPTQ